MIALVDNTRFETKPKHQDVNRVQTISQRVHKIIRSSAAQSNAEDVILGLEQCERSIQEILEKFHEQLELHNF